MKNHSLVLVFLVSFVTWVALGASSAVAAECPSTKTQPDLNYLQIKFDEMPDPASARQAACGGTMAYTLIARPITLNPITRTDAASFDLTRRIYDSLLGSTPEFKRMAEAASTANVGDRGQSITFTLRRGLKFANGDPVTAEDVRFTFERLIYPKEIATSITDLIACGDGKLPSVQLDSTNSHKITFTCSVTTRNLLLFLGGVEILSKKKVLELVPTVERSPKDFVSVLGMTVSPAQLEGIGAGPFVLNKIDPATVAEFKRNKFFWEADERGNQLPYLEGIRILIAPTQGQEIALAQFRAGQTDWLIPRPEDIAVLQSDRASRGFPVNDDIKQEATTSGTTFWVLSWTAANLALRAVFRSKEFRQAMSHLTDRDTMKRNIFLGLAAETYWHLHPDSPFHLEREKQSKEYRERADKAKFPFNLEKARIILDKLGLAPGPDGIRTIPGNFQSQGNPPGRLEFVLSPQRGHTLREAMAESIAQDARKVGINIKLEPKDSAALVDALLSGKYEAILTSAGGGYTPESTANIFTCTGSLHFFNVDCPSNPTSFERRVDELYQQGATAFKDEEAKRIWDDAQLLIGEHQPIIYLVQPNVLFAYRTDVLRNHGYSPNLAQDFIFCANGKCRGG
jgi:peptide/nickel transport system substrate-binding protein